jgi:hypothetical protein
MSKMRILVLTSSTGGGHDARAEAFAEWCFQLYRHDVDVRIEQMLEKSSVINRTGVNLYNRIQKGAPWMHKVFFTLVEGLSFLNSRKVTFGGAYYLAVLRDYQPHLVFSVHDCLNRGYFQRARRKRSAPTGCAVPLTAASFPAAGGIRATGSSRARTCIFRARPRPDYAVKKGIPAERTKRARLPDAAAGAPGIHVAGRAPGLSAKNARAAAGSFHGLPRDRRQRCAQPLRPAARAGAPRRPLPGHRDLRPEQARPSTNSSTGARITRSSTATSRAIPRPCTC